MANAIWSRPLFAIQKLIESIGSVREKVKYPAECVVEDVHWRGEILGCPYLCIMCGRGCTLEGGNPGVSLPLHNVW